jgi:hypothetical protein
VTLTGLTHTYPSDVDILLVGPAGQKVIIMSDVGGSYDISGVTVTLDDAAASSLTTSIVTSGTYKPTNLGASSDTFSSPAPAGPYVSTLSAFNGTNPNGTWSLYVVDAATPDAGSISGGWSILITTTGGTAVIGDTVWNDLDGDGVQEAGEPGLAGREVYLDSNVNGQWDSGEPKLTTDVSGNYSFTGLAAGSYVVAQVPRLGWNQTYPVSPATYSVTLTDGQTRNDLDFGDYELPHQEIPVVASVDGTVQDTEPNTVFETLDTAGVYDFAGNSATATIGERRGVFEFNVGSLNYAGSIVGASFSFFVSLLGSSSGADMTCSVYAYSGDGVVSLADATAASSLVGTFLATSGAITVPLDAAIIQSLRSSGNHVGLMVRMPAKQGNYAGISSLESSFAKPTLNLSALVLPPAEVRSSVWNDLDADGVQDAGEPGVPGVPIELYSSLDETLRGRAITDANGNYAITGVLPNLSYFAIARAPVGYIFTSMDAGGDDTKDSDAYSTGGIASFALSSGQSDTTRDVGLVGASPGFGFAFRAGAVSGTTGRAVTTDAAGNIYLTGTFSSSADFDPGPGTYSLTGSSGDAFVAAYTPQGALLWARRMGGSSQDLSYAITVTADGSVYTCGSFQSSADFDPGPGTSYLTAAGGLDGFVSKLDSQGNFIWAKRVGGTGSDSVFGMKVAANGSVYLTGTFTGTADFDPSAATFNLTSYGGNDVFVVKLDSAANFVWACQMGGTGSENGNGVAIASDGSIVISGDFTGTADFDPGADTYNLTSAGLTDTFVAKLTAAGALVWARGMGGTDVQSNFRLAIASDDSVYTTGYFAGTADFNPGDGVFNLTSVGSDDIYVSKLDAAGSFMWADRVGGVNTDMALDIAIAADDSAFLTGYFVGAADFDPSADTFTMTSAGAFDNFILKLDSDGSFAWTRRLGATLYAEGDAISLAADGCVYTIGNFGGVADFDPGSGTYNVTSSGTTDFFVSKILPDHAPTNVNLSINFVNENQPIGTLVGNLSSSDPDPGESFKYTLVSGIGSDDNTSFTINTGGQLITAAVLDTETQPTYSIRVRTTDYSGMWFEKVFTVTALNVTEPFIVSPAKWTDGGITLKLSGDGKLHAYRSGTTIDAVPPHVFAKVSAILITGRSDADDVLTVDCENGSPVPVAGMTISGGTHVLGDTFVLKGTAADDDVTLNANYLHRNGSVLTLYSSFEFFAFDLGGGVNALSIDHATVGINRDDAISAGTSVTLDGGELNFNGHTVDIGDLTILDNGRTDVGVIKSTTTSVTLGTLTASSIVGDSLTIGVPARTLTWDGGGSNNQWSTAENWAENAVPQAGDNLVFPAAAAKPASVNSFPDTVFGSIAITGGDYQFLNNPIESKSLDVRGDATLAAVSIICDSLMIGSTSGSGSVVASAATKGAVAAPASDASESTHGNAPATESGDTILIDSPALVIPATTVSLASEGIYAAAIAAPTFSMRLESEVESPKKMAVPAPLVIYGGTGLAVSPAMSSPKQSLLSLSDAGLFIEHLLASRSCVFAAQQSFDTATRLKDSSVIDSLASVKRNSPSRLASHEIARLRALESVVGEFAQSTRVGMGDAYPIASKQRLRHGSPVREAVDGLSARLFADSSAQ